MSDGTPLVRVMALHALEYCPRLFFLEEVEEIRIADDRVFAGRRLHSRLEKDEEGTFQSFTLASETLGIRGKVDCLRRRDGLWIPYEHKRGRPRRDDDVAAAWPSDRLQLGAYALLLEESLGETIPEGRIRYHAENVVVTIPIDEALREDVQQAVAQAKQLREAVVRPPVTEEAGRCVRCSLSPVCLPDEARLVKGEIERARRLFPPDDERRVLHITQHDARLGKRGKQLRLKSADGTTTSWPIRQVRSVAMHGFAQVSVQAMRLCGEQDVAVHWMTGGGRYVGSYVPAATSVQRKVRQYKAMSDIGTTLVLSRKLVEARLESQAALLMRATRGGRERSDTVQAAINGIRRLQPEVRCAERRERLLGLEGQGAALYFGALPELVSLAEMKPDGRSRRPPRDPFNALISFGYALLLADITSAVVSVGLEPALGFYHQPRSSAPPLALDLMELFRVPVVDMAVLAAVNRRSFDPVEDFTRAGPQVWLSSSGRKKLLGVYERRKGDTWHHPAVDYSLTYVRHFELEARLLEKEWIGEAGLFATARLR